MLSQCSINQLLTDVVSITAEQYILKFERLLSQQWDRLNEVTTHIMFHLAFLSISTDSLMSENFNRLLLNTVYDLKIA